MKYYSLLNFTKEPFSNSPDPEMFFKSSQHQRCVQKLELAIHLQKGLSVVIGKIGTGKSTICRQLLRQIHNNDKIQAHLILDPEFNSSEEFLLTIAKTFAINDTEKKSAWQIKDIIKDYLFEQAAKLGKIPVLVIDEGQKLPDFCLEILREFLNYETNKNKLLQIIIFAQEEFNHTLKSKANFADRIASRHHLSPLNFKDTRDMITFRLRKSHRLQETTPNFFSPLTMFLIYLISGGYPRKIVMLCSKLIITLLVNNKKKAGLFEVINCLRETGNFAYGKIFKFAGILLITSMVIILIFNFALRRGSTAIAERITTPAPLGIKATPTKPATIPHPPINKTTKIERSKKVQQSSNTPLPRILGSLPVESGISLSKMVARVYGRYTRARLRMVMNANKNIKSVRKIRPGDIIIFPREKKKNFLPEPTDFWLELAHKSNLNSAYEIIKNYPENAEPIIIVPTLRPGEDGQIVPVFMLVVERRFTKKAKAVDILKKLPRRLQINARIRQG